MPDEGDVRRQECTMASNELLGVYLNDHLAGAAAGVELAGKLRSNNEGTPYGPVLAGVERDIQQDRATLEELMERLGIEKQPVKQAVGWIFEKLSRLRINRQLVGSADLARMMEMETLSLGIEGKLAMWQVLKEIAPADPRLAATDFDVLVDRARQQRRTLEPLRLESAVKAFSSG
jgi:hypothetical protein